MCTNPLSDFFAMGGFNPRFESNSTALWRGYVGRWEIVDGRLYLVELHGTSPFRALWDAPKDRVAKRA